MFGVKQVTRLWMVPCLTLHVRLGACHMSRFEVPTVTSTCHMPTRFHAAQPCTRTILASRPGVTCLPQMHFMSHDLMHVTMYGEHSRLMCVTNDMSVPGRLAPWQQFMFVIKIWGLLGNDVYNVHAAMMLQHTADASQYSVVDPSTVALRACTRPLGEIGPSGNAYAVLIDVCRLAPQRRPFYHTHPCPQNWPLSSPALRIADPYHVGLGFCSTTLPLREACALARGGPAVCGARRFGTVALSLGALRAQAFLGPTGPFGCCGTTDPRAMYHQVHAIRGNGETNNQADARRLTAQPLAEAKPSVGNQHPLRRRMQKKCRLRRLSAFSS